MSYHTLPLKERHDIEIHWTGSVPEPDRSGSGTLPVQCQPGALPQPGDCGIAECHKSIPGRGLNENTNGLIQQDLKRFRFPNFTLEQVCKSWTDSITDSGNVLASRLQISYAPVAAGGFQVRWVQVNRARLFAGEIGGTPQGPSGIVVSIARVPLIRSECASNQHWMPQTLG